MLRQMQRILLLLFLLQVWNKIEAQDPKFPTMDDIFDEFYQTEVQLSDENQDGTSLATEYYDKSQGRGRLDVMVYGDNLSIFYYNSTGDILEVNSTSCIVSPAEQSDYFYSEIFFGWLNKEPLIIGPSALLWFAQGLNPDYVNQENIMGIDCDHYQLTLAGKYENVTYDYYFSVKEWTTPYQQKGKRVPIRISVNGMSSRDSQKKNQIAPVNQVIDFSYIKPTIDDNRLQPDIGLGCFGRRTDFSLPRISKEFRFAMEVYDLLNAETEVETSATFYRVWFSSYNKLGRLDKYTKELISAHIYDFKNGVTYSITNTETCTINPLQNSIFEDDDDLNGYIKTPERVLGLSGDFYFMGYRELRGINCRVFESAERDAFFKDDHYYLVVTTVYFTEPFTKVIVQGEDSFEVPVFIQITAYDKPSKVAYKKQHNIFAFDDVVGPTMFDDFPLQDCFPLIDQKSYFVLNFPVDIPTAKTLEGNNVFFLDQTKSAVMNVTGVSSIRIPYMKAEYTTVGVYVTGLLLERPSVLNQFWRQFYGPSKAYDVKDIDEANTKELCANACIDEKTFTCRGFHFCGGLCYINRRSLTEEMINAGTKDLGVCEVYLRSDLNSTNADPYLDKALKALKDANITVRLPFETYELSVYVDGIIIGDGPYDKHVTEKSYNIIYAGFQIPAAEEITTSVEKPDVASENECYRACRDDTGINCQSFSYCPDASNGMCRISSLLISKSSSESVKNLDNNKLCNVYSRLNLDYYDAYPGKVLKVQGEDSYTNITVEECAVKCKGHTGLKKDFMCRGFEYCSKTRSCTLHSKHVLDIAPGDIVDTDDKCTHYAAKYIADYLEMGPTLIEDSSNVRTDITLEECARACSEEVTTCKSFNYCPPTNPYGTGTSCSMTSKTLSDYRTKLFEKDSCRLYSKRTTVEGYGSRRRRPLGTGYSKGGFAGLVVGMIALGLFVGVLVFVGYSYYRSRRYNDGMSVKFVNKPST